MASSFYNIIASLQPSAADVLEAQSFAQTYLAAMYPDVDFREGTALYDTVIQPNATLIAITKTAIETYFANYTLMGMTDSTPTDFVDAILSNWFSTRNLGTNTVISANLYFAMPVNVTINTSQFFSPDNTLMFYPQQSMVVPASSMQFDSFSQSYYITIPLVAGSPGSSYNAVGGELLYFSNFNPFFLRATVNYITSLGTDTETNTQFFQRTQANISTRNLINRPSITSFIQNAFPMVSALTEIGYGDPQMNRDYVVTSSTSASAPVGIHIGGMVDIYAYVPVASNTITLTLDASGNGFLSGPIYSVSVAPSASYTGSLPASSVFTTGSPASIDAYGNLIPSGDVGFSTNQSLTLSYGASAAGQTATVEYNYFEFIESIQANVNLPANRVLCANLLVRGFNSYFLDFNFQTYSTTGLPANLPASISTFINALQPGQALVVADLVATLGIPQLVLPTVVSYSLYKTDFTCSSGTFVDILEPVDDTYNYYVGSVTINGIPLPVSGAY